MKTLTISAALALIIIGGCETVFIAAPSGTELHVIPPAPKTIVIPLPTPMFDDSRFEEGMQAQR